MAHDQEVVGLNPGCKRFASYYIKRKIEIKGSQMGHTKKKYLKNINA
jgi:hypothetical protein